MQEDVLLETVAIQNTKDRVFLFVRYLYPDETRPETRKISKKWADLCEAKVGETSWIFSISGSPQLQKPTAFHGLYILLYLKWKARHFHDTALRREFGISWIEPSHYSKRKRSILQVHHMKHVKLNASVFFLLEGDPFLNE